MRTPPEVIDDVRWSEFVDSRLDLFYTPDGIEEGKGFAEITDFAVYPNPAREKTNVKFELTKQGPVELSVYDINGRRVRNIFTGQKQVGEHLFPVSLLGLNPGYYLIRLKSGIRVQSKKLVIH
jgi:hypothetical protein